jgi:hypothetical protein
VGKITLTFGSFGSFMTFRRAALVVIAALTISQLVPLSRTNPPVTREVRWDSGATRALAQRACFDCHTNLTVWPWYSHVTPSSFLVINHVEDGRRRLNFSEWDTSQRATFADVQHDIENGDMPIWNYVLLHPEAKLSPAETSQLVEGFRRTFAGDPPIPGPPLRRR